MGCKPRPARTVPVIMWAAQPAKSLAIQLLLLHSQIRKSAACHPGAQARREWLWACLRCVRRARGYGRELRF